MKKEALLNPNTSGQGFYPGHVNHPLHAAVIAAGYVYSHSTNVGMFADGWNLYDTYGFPGTEHKVSLRHLDWGDYREPSMSWNTKVNCASGHQHYGKGEAELTKHLKSKARRYGLK